MAKLIFCNKQNLVKLGYNNFIQWYKDPSNVYIGKAKDTKDNNIITLFPIVDSPLDNPYDVTGHEMRQVFYDTYIRYRIKSEPKMMDALMKCKGKTMGCFCGTDKCHGYVLIKLLEEYK